MEITLKELEVQKLNLQPNDILIVKVNDLYEDDEDKIKNIANVFSRSFENNRVLITGCNMEFSVAKQNKELPIKFKKLHEDAVLPSYAREGDGALDLTAITEGILVTQGEQGEPFSRNPKDDNSYYYIEYDTGIACEFADNYVGLLFPRSSITKKELFLGNAVGVLDSSYKDSIKFRFKVDGTFSLLEQVNRYKKGERIGQLMLLERPKLTPVWVDELSGKDRGGGFGSTGT